MSFRMIVYPLVFLVLIQVFAPRHIVIDDRLKYHYNYLVKINPKIKNYNRIGFGRLSGKTIGICKSNTITSITIDYSAWQKFSNKRRLILLGHETGHCIFNLDHKNGVDILGCPESIMNDSIPNKWCANYNFEKYMKEIAGWK